MYAGQFHHPKVGNDGQAIILSKREAQYIRYVLMTCLSWAELNTRETGAGDVISTLYTALGHGRDSIVPDTHPDRNSSAILLDLKDMRDKL